MAGLLAGKVALVTGGASGIGRAAALAMAREGARVVVADVAEAGGSETVQRIVAAGGQALFQRADVADAADVATLVRRAVETYGRLDCAFNNAGIEGAIAAPHEYPDDAFDRVIAVNLKGVWLCLKAEVQQMLAQGGGAIVNTASAAGLVGAPTIAAYAASKHGVVGLTKSFALAYARQGIRVNAVCPGIIRTPMVERSFMARGPDAVARLEATEPVGRLGTPEEVAEAVVWLCSDAAAFVTGVALPVDGGLVAR